PHLAKPAAENRRQPDGHTPHDLQAKRPGCVVPHPKETRTMSLDLRALETSFDLVAPRGDELMDEFYSRLFAAAPAVRPLFPDDMRRQKTMLLGELVLLRKSLRDLET